jgi:hypothetical protein
LKFWAETAINSGNILGQLKTLGETLQTRGHTREASAVNDVLLICEQPTDLGGLGLDPTGTISENAEAEIVFLVSAWLESLNSTDRAKVRPKPLESRPKGRYGMTLSEKIFAIHDVTQKGHVRAGDLIRVDVDWVIASEASWAVRLLSLQHLNSQNMLTDQCLGHGINV